MAHRSKILDGSRWHGLGSFGDLGPGELAVDEFARVGLALPDVSAMRRYRLRRVRDQLDRSGFPAGLFFDPVNVRYATDSTNMQLWVMHTPVRYALVLVDGPVVLFDLHGTEHLTEHLELVDEVRAGRAWSYFLAGPNRADAARVWAEEICKLLARHGAGGRLAVDRVDPPGVAALAELGVEVGDGQEVMELARAVKSVDEIAAMRCAIHVAEQGIGAMRRALRPGLSEQELWSRLHTENVRRGGEWIETRLLASGPRTNPWYQECSARVIREGDLVAFDTDLIGPYGYCADISRTWLCGDADPTPDQRELYRIAHAQITENIDRLQPGMSFLEFAEGAFQLPDRYRANRYTVVLHGVGLCDEYPAVMYPEDAEFAYDGVFEPGMAVCVESYVGEVGGREGVKLEEQVLITEDGCEALSTVPYEGRLLAR